jgi:hypothetical protein
MAPALDQQLYEGTLFGNNIRKLVLLSHKKIMVQESQK